MLRKACLFAVLVGVLSGVTLQYGIDTNAQTSLLPCDYVVHFQIMKRPQEIQASDIVWLENLPDFGPGTIDAIGTLIQNNGPINDPVQLDLLPSSNVSSKMKLLLRSLFNLGGKDTCKINV